MMRSIIIFLTLMTVISCSNKTTKNDEEIEYNFQKSIEVDNSVRQNELLLEINFEEEYKHILGTYYVDSFEIILKEGIYNINEHLNVLEFDNVTEHNIEGNDNIFFSIQYLSEDKFLLKYNFSFSGSANPAHNYIQFRMPAADNKQFASIHAGMGHGGLEIYFYFIEDHVFVIYDHHQQYIDIVDDELVLSSEEKLKCEFIFRKR